MRIALAADHAGYLLKDELAAWLRDQGHDVSDLGTNGPESVDYPEFGRKLLLAHPQHGATQPQTTADMGVDWIRSLGVISA